MQLSKNGCNGNCAPFGVWCGEREECCWGAFWWCVLHIAELHRQDVRKQRRLTLMWTWMKDRQSCRRRRCLPCAPEKSFYRSIGRLRGEKRHRQAEWLKQAKQLLYLLISHSSFFGWDVSLFLCLKVGVSIQFPPPPYPSVSHSAAVFSFWAVYLHAHTHTHSFPHILPPLVASSVCVCRHQTQGLIISAPTPCPPSPVLFFYFALLSCISSVLN